MTTVANKRDYSLVGESTRKAIETGLASAEWYHTDVSRKAMKELMQRSDGPAIRDTIIWIAAILGSAAGIIWFAYDFAAPNDESANADGNQVQITDVSGAPVSPEEARQLEEAVKGL